MPFKLTREIPARTETIEIDWCNKNWLAMSQTFRDIRAKARRPMTSCGLCKHPFVDGEMMALACFSKSGNKPLCGTCADLVLANEVEGKSDGVSK